MPAMVPSAPLLELRNVVKSFSGVRVLADVDFDVRAGEVHALVGENGAGKSTLMNIVSGVTAPDAGEMRWQGMPVRPRSPREAQRLGIAFVHQELALVPQLSAAENIFLGRHPAGRGWVRWGEIDRRARALLAELGQPIDPRRLVADLSLAERQLVEIARALAFDSRLIIMDEPTAPLADGTPRAFPHYPRLAGARRERHLHLAPAQGNIPVCDRVTVLRDGRRVLTAPRIGDQPRRARARDGGGGADRAISPPRWRRRGVRGGTARGRGGELRGAAGRDRWPRGTGRCRPHRTAGVDLRLRRAAGRPELCRRGRPVKVRTPRDAIRHGLALVPDDRKAKGLVPGASLAMNIALAGGRARLFIRAVQERRAAAQLVGDLRIKAAGLDQPVLYLSGGNQQKAVLAKWLLAGANVFLLDEPTRGIDVRSKAEIYDLIRALARRGAAVLLASSELDELLRLADRILVMQRGRIAGEVARAEAGEECIMRLATGGAA